MESLKKYKYINKEFFRNYRKVKKNVWKGRIDGNDPDSLRWHQSIKAIDLESNLEDLKFKNAVCFIGFSSDEGVERNKGNVGNGGCLDRLSTSSSTGSGLVNARMIKCLNARMCE